MIRHFAAAAAAILLLAGPAHAAADKAHHVVIQVDEADPARMNLALNNAVNIVKRFRDRLEEVEVRIVTFGPGITMVRADKSPVAERVAAVQGSDPEITFNVCDNTLAGMRKAEGHDIPILAKVTHVDSGAATIVDLEEGGWSYVRP